jgi:nucleoside-diphosphate-sugar epimerase
MPSTTHDQTPARTILVSGAGGYIGSVLTRELLAAGHRVVAYDRFFFGRDALAGADGDGRLTLVQKDIRDAEPRDLTGVDVVCDLAALSNDPSGEIDPGLTHAINHDGRRRLSAAAKRAGVGRYVLSSSCSVYGAGDTLELTEDAATAPLTAYAESTLNAERDALALAGDGFCPVVLRNATVFGVSPRMRFDLVINLMTLHAVERGHITVMGGGRQWRPLVHVRDVVRAFCAAIEAPAAQVAGQVFNIGLCNHQIRSLAFIVRETLPIPVTVAVAPDDADRRNYSISFAKARRVLGFAATHGIEHGVREIYDALKYGRVDSGPRTVTVGWYRSILEAKRLISAVELNGRVL